MPNAPPNLWRCSHYTTNAIPSTIGMESSIGKGEISTRVLLILFVMSYMIFSGDYIYTGHYDQVLSMTWWFYKTTQYSSSDY